MNTQTKDVINSTFGTAAEMTHSLSNYGDGNMGQGIFKLWLDGNRNGSVKTAAVIGIAELAIWWLSRDYRSTKKAELICDAYCAGAEEGLHTLQYGEDEATPCCQE